MPKSKTKPRDLGGRPVKTGAWSIVHRQELIEQYPEIPKYLRQVRMGLVRDVAGTEDELSEMQRLLIDRIMTKLSVCRLVECYFEKHGILRRDRLGDKILELEPAMNQWLMLDRAIKEALSLLGIKRIQPKEEPEQTIAEIIREHDTAETKAQAQDSGEIMDHEPSGETKKSEEDPK